MTGVAMDLPNELPGPEKPDGSPEGYDPDLLSDEPIAGLPAGVFDDERPPLRPDDPADRRFGELEDQEVHAEPVYDDLDDDLFPPDGLDNSAVEQAELVALLRQLTDADDRAFKVNERAQIRCEIQALHSEVRTLTELSRHQQEAVEKMLENVQRGSERMGRKDWVTYTIGAATSVIIMEMVPPLALLPVALHAFHALGHLLIDA
jgi:hypothetical protein